MQAKRKDNSSVVTVQSWMPSPELARAIAQQQSNKHKNSSKAKRLALEHTLAITLEVARIQQRIRELRLYSEQHYRPRC